MFRPFPAAGRLCPLPPSQSTASRSNPLLGISLKVASVCALLSMSGLVKAADGVPVGQLIFFRSAFALVPIVALLVWRGELFEGIRTNRPLGHFWRGAIGVCGMICGFTALTLLPLPEAVAIGYAMPLLIVIFGAVFLKETVRLYRWSAVAVGLVGVGIIMWPRLSIFDGSGEVSSLTIGALVALLGCVFGAVVTLHIRKLVQTERSATIALYFSVVCALVSLASLPFGWVALSLEQAVTLVVAGIAGGVGQVLLTECYRHADVSVVAPFEYTSLLLSIAVGYLAFHEVPTVEMLIGATLVVGAGLFIIWREAALGLERRRQKENAVSPPA